MSFTTPERDHLIKDAAVRAAVEKLKARFFIGLHHNWHDHDFAYDPLFDFSMAGDDDLIEREGKPFERIGLDACNFAPASFAPRPGGEKFWDVISTSRAVFFKGLPEFLQAIRTIYDSGRLIRVLHLCPVPAANKEGTVLHDIRQRFEAMFSPEERRFFNLMTMEWDNPFPLDLETLAFFYRSSRIYVHSAPSERRARAGAYAWATGMPMVSRDNVASILPKQLRRPPFFFEYDEPAQMSQAILTALDGKTDDPEWKAVADEFRIGPSTQRLEIALRALATRRGESLSSQNIHSLGFDIRLGRHHGIGGGANQVDQPLGEFCRLLLNMSDAELATVAECREPELEMASLTRVAELKTQPSVAPQEPNPGLRGLKTGLRRLLSRGR
ncbi:hypothetical protein LJR220_002780 [Bradyrhizobium sp. LjRoot220]|uniref:hypothetical protein n=1 Tax=Bradyrhizobium sp. LjRoot220 TaxID=3342284 RepID=UPI003ECC3B7C